MGCVVEEDVLEGCGIKHKSKLATLQAFRPLNPPILGDFDSDSFGSAPPELGLGGFLR